MWKYFATMNLWRFCVLTILSLICSVHCDTCTLTNLPKDGPYCTAELNCIQYASYDVKTWDCIRHLQRRQNYGYYNTEEFVTYYDEEYNLFIFITSPREMDIFNLDLKNVVTLSLINGNIMTTPDEVFKMARLKKITVSDNKVSSINLYNFLSMYNLEEIDFSNNIIDNVDLPPKENIKSYSSQLSNVRVINLSWNYIEVVPNNFVLHFTQLQHLDLSHNMISSIGLLTFEGIIHLKTLDISHNNIIKIGNALARFIKLEKLSMSNNNLTNFLDYNFGSLTNLNTLNASFNHITSIENNAFQSLVKLQCLDLGNNKIQTISNQLLSNNENLQILYLNDNSIQSIEADSFKSNDITSFNIKNNCFTGTLQNNTFNGIHVDHLDLSGGNITKIIGDAFYHMFDLKKLNLSSNAISNISYSAFSSLESLEVLDLSHNKLIELYFENNTLKNISKLFLQHNNIQKITKNDFYNFLSLIELDLSYNDLKEIEPQSFLKLTNVKILRVSYTHFVNNLKNNILEGLTSLQQFEMLSTRTVSLKNGSFTGLIAVTSINSNYGQLTEIEYNAFLGASSLEILMLSNNQISAFCINTSSISKIQEIYLNNNLITNISNETFTNLYLLRKLDLANNNVYQINSDVFKDLKSLTYLDLSSNEIMNIIGNPFQNLSSLSSLLLENVKTDVSFANSSASAEFLCMASCSLINLNNVYVFNIKNINYLNLSLNEITFIDKDSFRSMPSLVSLDLSSNKIVTIQPSSFIKVTKLIKLNLYNNRITYIPFGIFDKTIHLRELNLSNNILQNFDARLIQSPVIDMLSLDNNIITNLKFETFFTKISKLSIGGNKIPCKILAELKSEFPPQFVTIITAATLNYHAENVDGIPCETFSDDHPVSNRVSNESNIFISSLFVSMKDILEKLDKTIQSISETTNKTEQLQNKAIVAVDTFAKTQITSINNQIRDSDFLTKLININNDTNIQLSEMKLFLNNLSENYSENTIRPIIKNGDNDTYFNLFKTMIKQETNALREEFKNAIGSISRGTEMPFREALVKQDRDTNVVFYFIAVCLAIILATYLGNIVFRHVTSLRRSNSSRSTATISNNIEME